MKPSTSVRQRSRISASISIAVLTVVAVLASLLLGSAGTAQARESLPRSPNIPRVEPGCDTGLLEDEYVVCCWDENGSLECTGIV
ncbi:hypothetical protein LRD69_19230 [Streptomyces sp. JH14]|uniref:hypothetical protein n=1 Tax=Streptomyces sp. JH14 TaxID=2793630 RepID=UPI0023F82498|nr:hypothetical protein [Streptomyces sp. JH14]MDF6044231.1 hypothetical protein [Streptomyces sp. JH14]